MVFIVHHPNANVPNCLNPITAPAATDRNIQPLPSVQQRDVDWDNTLASILSSLAVGVATGTTPKLSRSRQQSLKASYGRLKSEESNVIRRAQVMDTLIAWGGESTPESNM